QRAPAACRRAGRSPCAGLRRATAWLDRGAGAGRTARARPPGDGSLHPGGARRGWRVAGLGKPAGRGPSGHPAILALAGQPVRAPGGARQRHRPRPGRARGGRGGRAGHRDPLPVLHARRCRLVPRPRLAPARGDAPGAAGGARARDRLPGTRMTTTFDAFDHACMARALQLAARGLYTARPNPVVGCVIAKDGAVVGEGWHPRAGEPHAEVFALREAGERARGATAYVTLEPCAHHGRTPPCAEALVQAGVARVVAAMRDPFPRVDGAGFARLQAAGIAVASGLMEGQARDLNRGFLSRFTRGRPWLRIKLAASLDGRTAMASGESKWITGEAARADVQRWRARSGAILTGADTVLADDPALTVRLGDATPFQPPLRVVLDSRLRSLAMPRVRDGSAPTLYLHGPDAVPPPGL